MSQNRHLAIYPHHPIHDIVFASKELYPLTLTEVDRFRSCPPTSKLSCFDTTKCSTTTRIVFISAKHVMGNRCHQPPNFLSSYFRPPNELQPQRQVSSSY